MLAAVAFGRKHQVPTDQLSPHQPPTPSRHQPPTAANRHPQGKLFIVMEYAGGGNLHEFIKSQGGPLAEDVIWKLLIQVGG
jgi:serine/threonine protein kinase